MSESYTIGGDTWQGVTHIIHAGQTFRPSEDFTLHWVDLYFSKYNRAFPPIILIYAADANHEPSKDYISRDRFSIGREPGPFGSHHIRISMTPVPLLKDAYYCIILRAPLILPPATFSLLYDKGDATYPRGIRILSTDTGETWTKYYDDDHNFVVFGEPPSPPPPPEPPIPKFIPTKLTQTQTADGFEILLGTNVPCHLTLYWTSTEPLKHPQTRVLRGIDVPWYTRYCFVNFHEVEQEEAGDTLYHTFIIEPWPVCETRWFTIRGNVDEVLSPSVGPIFKKHRPIYVPTQFFFPFGPELCTAPLTAQWQKVDTVTSGLLKDLLPPEAKVAFLHLITKESDRPIGLRPTGSTHTEVDLVRAYSHVWAMVALDEDKAFEVYVYSTYYQEIWLMGYATEAAIVMFDNPIVKTPPAGDAWQTIDLSSTCPDAIGIFCEVARHIDQYPRGIRKHGSTDNRIFPFYHNWPVVGCDQNQKIDYYPDQYTWKTAKLFITGYIKKSATFFTNAPEHSLDEINIYKTITLDSGPSLAFFESYSEWGFNKFAMRPFGSDEDLFYKMNGYHSFAICPINSNGKLEGKIDHLETDFFLMGTGT